AIVCECSINLIDELRPHIRNFQLIVVSEGVPRLRSFGASVLCWPPPFLWRRVIRGGVRSRERQTRWALLLLPFSPRLQELERSADFFLALNFVPNRPARSSTLEPPSARKMPCSDLIARS